MLAESRVGNRSGVVRKGVIGLSGEFIAIKVSGGQKSNEVCRLRSVLRILCRWVCPHGVDYILVLYAVRDWRMRLCWGLIAEHRPYCEWVVNWQRWDLNLTFRWLGERCGTARNVSWSRLDLIWECGWAFVYNWLIGRCFRYQQWRCDLFVSCTRTD